MRVSNCFLSGLEPPLIPISAETMANAATADSTLHFNQWPNDKGVSRNPFFRLELTDISSSPIMNKERRLNCL